MPYHYWVAEYLALAAANVTTYDGKSYCYDKSLSFSSAQFLWLIVKAHYKDLCCYLVSFL